MCGEVEDGGRGGGSCGDEGEAALEGIEGWGVGGAIVNNECRVGELEKNLDAGVVYVTASVEGLHAKDEISYPPRARSDR